MRTTIQISESLRRRLKVIASFRDISYEEVLNDLINVFENSIPFKTEREFSEWFEKNVNKFGFKRIVEKRKTPTDYRIEDKDGKIKNVELELIGYDFVRHKHDPKETDLIICVFSDKDEMKGVPVISMIDSKEIIKKVIAPPDRKHTTITIPIPLYKKIEKRIKKTGFTSVSDYVTYVLREVISSLEEEQKKEVFTKEEERKVKERLRALGYLE